MENKKVLGKADIATTGLKALVKPQANESMLVREAEFLCQEHNAGCRRNGSVVEDDDILF